MEPTEPPNKKFKTERSEGKDDSRSTVYDRPVEKYNVWFSKDIEENDEIPCEPNYEIYTLIELLEATKDCNVTQMAICGSGIPPLTEIFPYLKRLRLTDVSILDQRLYYNISRLINLEVLEIFNNKSLRTIPSGIGDLKSLRKLILSDCGLTEITESISLLTNLEVLEIYDNESLRTIPSSIGDLKSLRRLILRDCGLTEIAESIGSLINLEMLEISGSSSLHTLPTRIGDIISLKKLDLHCCGLTEIPISICSLTALEELIFSGNKMLPMLPDFIGCITSLKKLHVSSCDLIHLPISICWLSALEELNISGNQKLRMLPDNIGRITSLKKLHVSSCDLTLLPISICRLTALEELYISGNEKLSMLPDNIGHLKSLKELYIRKCDITQLPRSICSLVALRQLDLSNNKKLQTLPDDTDILGSPVRQSARDFYGTQFSSMYFSLTNSPVNGCRKKPKAKAAPMLGSLKELYALNCDLTHLPTRICSLTTLETLDVSGNENLNTLPDSFGMLRSLKKFYARNCNLTQLPSSVGSLSKLEELCLSSNNFGSISNQIFGLQSLRKLDMSECGIDNLPERISSLLKLEELCLSRNSLRSIPDGFFRMKGLKKLDISQCGIDKLPESISSLSMMEDLRLSSNNLRSIPDWIFGMKSLKKLDVSQCSLEHLPESIPSLQHLEQLDLGGNSLLLRIPSSLCDLVSLTNIGCEGCVSMSYPPYDICTQGVAAMRTYFTELENTHEISKEFVPVTGRMTDHSLNTVEQHQMGVLSSQLRFIPRAQVPVLDGIVSDVNSDTPILSLEPVISDSSDFELEIQVEDRTLSMRSMSRMRRYAMTETRGRALIISNSFENRRQGSEHDYFNVKLMLQKFGFITSGNHKSYTASEIVETIHSETQLVAQETGVSVHGALGSFMLVILSHGDEGAILGSDSKHLKITDILDLLSPKNFPAMKGKPKVVIIQACAGNKREILLTDIKLPQLFPNQETNNDVDGCDDTESSVSQDQPPVDILQQPAYPANEDKAWTDDDDLSDVETQDISVADFMIMQSSFDSFVSPRRETIGSPFIRALVSTFYRYAHQHHLEEMASLIREVVAEAGVQRTECVLRRQQRHKNPYLVSMPQTRCTFIGKRLYFLPGINMRTDDHPNALVNPVRPHYTATVIEHQTDTIVRTEQNGQIVRQATYLNWSVRRMGGRNTPIIKNSICTQGRETITSSGPEAENVGAALYAPTQCHTEEKICHTHDEGCIVSSESEDENDFTIESIEIRATVPPEIKKAHGQIHDVLLKCSNVNVSQDEPKEYITFTILSYGSAAARSLRHLMFCIQGYCRSVSDYCKITEGQLLKVTTSHIRYTEDFHADIFGKEKPSSEPSHAHIVMDDPLKLRKLEHSDPVHLEDEVKKLLQNNFLQPTECNEKVVKYLHNTVDILVDLDSPAVRFTISPYDQETQTVVGSLIKQTPLNSFSTSESILYELDNPDDNATVTVTVISVRSKEGLVHSLYRMVAGDLEETPHEIEESNQRLTCVRLTNDILHRIIKERCQQAFLNTLDSEAEQKWKDEGPMFIVSSAVNQGEDGRVHINLIPPTDTDNAGEHIFSHPEQSDIFVRMYEPRSPPGEDFSFGRNHVSGRSEMKSCHNKKMDFHLKKELERKNNEIITSLRKHHNVSEDSTAAVSAIVRTSRSRPNSSVMVSVIFVSDILRNQLRQYGEGWMSSTVLLSSLVLKDEISQYEMQHSPSTGRGVKNVCAACTKPALLIPHDIETLKKCLRPLTRIHEQRYRYLVKSTLLEMELLPNTKLLFKCGTEPSWKDDLTQMDDKELNDTKRCMQLSELKMLVPLIEQNLKNQVNTTKQPQGNPNMDIAITTLEVVAPEPAKDDTLTSRRDVYFIVALGKPDSIALRRQFQYHDPKNTLVCNTWFQNNPALATLIENCWKFSDSSVAKHAIIQLKLKKEDSFQYTLEAQSFLPLCKNGTHIRVVPKMKKKCLVDIWSHEPSMSAAEKALRKSARFLVWWDRVDKSCVTTIASEIKRSLYHFLPGGLPTSSQYPTIHIKLQSLDPKVPNRVGEISTKSSERKPEETSEDIEITQPDDVIACLPSAVENFIIHDPDDAIDNMAYTLPLAKSTSYNSAAGFTSAYSLHGNRKGKEDCPPPTIAAETSCADERISDQAEPPLKLQLKGKIHRSEQLFCTDENQAHMMFFDDQKVDKERATFNYEDFAEYLLNPKK